MGEITNTDGIKTLYDIRDLKETLNPDFDDDDYEDPYAELWEAFVNALIECNADYLVVIR